MLDIRRYVMDTNPRRKLIVSSITALLLLSSILFLAEVKADPNDLEISNLFEPSGTPPPRANIAYEFIVEWTNDGASSEDATVRLYADCDQSGTASESETITMGADESGTVNLSITFDDDDADADETCYSATIYQGGSHYGEFENFVNVEPESGTADLWAEMDMEQEQAAPGETIVVKFQYGNTGDVSSLNPVTIMAYFDPVTKDFANYFSPSPFRFDYLSPPPPDAPPEAPPEEMEWEFVIPDATCDMGPDYENKTNCENVGGVWTHTDGRMHKLTVFIDSDENNTAEDNNLANNKGEYEFCIGNCDQPDLQVAEEGAGEESIMSVPLEPISGGTISFTYGIANMGEGDADCPPAGPNCPGAVGDLITHLEVQDCSGTVTDYPCSHQEGGEWVDNDWKYINQSKVVRTPIAKCCENNVFHDDNVLKLNWSTEASDSGLWNVRILVDANNVVEEIDETNNYLDWYKVHGEYFDLQEQRPDLIVVGIDPGANVFYVDDEQTLQIHIAQSDFGDANADNVEVSLRINDPNSGWSGWGVLPQKLSVLLAPTITSFEYKWTPSDVGNYEFDIHVDYGGDILEWNEDNNKITTPKSILVEPKLPDLQITDITISPLSDDGYGMVGVNGEFKATVTNNGVRALDSVEALKLSVTFYISEPFSTQLGKIYVFNNPNQTLDVSESVDVIIPIKFTLNDNYKLVAIVDEGLTPNSEAAITEVDETNNVNFIYIYAASSVDAHVTNLDVELGDGLAGRDHPITFDIGMSNLAEDQTYRLYFNVSVDGGFGWGEILDLSLTNSTGTYPIGSGFQVTGNIAYADFNSSYLVSQVSIPWIPDKSTTDTYNVSVTVSSNINVNESNDMAFVNNIQIEKLTTNVLVDAIKVTESGGSATIKVTVGYPRGELAEVNVLVGLEVYKASDYADGNPPLDSLTPKNLTQLVKGDSRSISFTWAVKNGDYIFVAIVDPNDDIKEVDEMDNRYPSKLTTFGGPSIVDIEEEEDGGLLPAPSLVYSLVILGSLAFFRRRR